MADSTPKHFPKTARLRAAPEFQSVFKNGLKHSGVFFRLYFLANPQLCPRLGLAVPKKAVPLSVRRNLIKRLSREYFRQQSDLQPGDYVLVAQAAAKKADSPQLQAALVDVFVPFCRTPV